MSPNAKRIITSLVAVVAILGVAAGGKQALGSSPGDRCGEVAECKWGSKCIGKRCYQSCSADGDCPSGWHCGNTSVTVTTQRTFSRESHDGTERICFAPKASSR